MVSPARIESPANRRWLIEKLSAMFALFPGDVPKETMKLRIAGYAEHLAEYTEADFHDGLGAAIRQAATGHHVEVVNLKSLPEAIRGIVSTYGTNVVKVLDRRKGEFCPEVTPTDQERTLIDCWQWIANGIGRPCTVVVRSGKTSGAQADFLRSERKLSLYRDVLGSLFFEQPYHHKRLAVLCHEIAHWSPHADEHGSDFAHDNDEVGGSIASFLLYRAEEALARTAGKGTDANAAGRKPPTKIHKVEGRDPRLPPTGTVLRREWKGTIHEVEVAGARFYWINRGSFHKSLSAVGRMITDRPTNGFAFFKLKEKEK
mgnify:CR=1 FL=1